MQRSGGWWARIKKVEGNVGHKGGKVGGGEIKEAS